MLTTYNYFTTFFVQITFVSIGSWLLDIGHLIKTTLGKRAHAKLMNDSVY